MDKRSIKLLMANHIHMLRLMNGYTQKDIADKVHKTINAVSNWELGNTSPPIDDLMILCKTFKVTPNQICGWDDCPELTEYIKSSKDAAQKVEELKKQKKEIEEQIKSYNELINRKQ